MIAFHVGDRVVLSSGEPGTIVGIIERAEYARDLETWRWASLSEGAIVLLDGGAFTHVHQPHLKLRRSPVEGSRAQ